MAKLNYQAEAFHNLLLTLLPEAENERLCQKLSLNDHLAWNDGRGEAELRNLVQFGSLLVLRAMAYQNAYATAAAQEGSGLSGVQGGNKSEMMNKPSPHLHAHRNTSFTSKNDKSKKPFCFRCLGVSKVQRVISAGLRGIFH